MDEIIRKLEEATEGSEVLDVAITRAIHGYKQDNPLWYTQQFTRSIDAALTLVPEDARWVVGVPDKLPPFANVEPLSVDHDMEVCEAATPALALCIASLKARKAKESSNG